ncbi:MAG: hypothetical protein JJ891_06865 [Rhizobiaceae bacterium]|nr:hypothetical protein [Rhizobiaceae bacterium]
MSNDLGAPRPLTELEAVNLILRAQGERPTNTLGPGSTVEGIKATEVLQDRVSKVLSEGYNFNTVEKMVLKVSTNGEVTVPSNVMSMYPTGKSRNCLLVNMGGRIFDREKGTFKIHKDVEIAAALSFPFDDLPQPVKWYVSIMAAMESSNNDHPGDAGLRITAREAEQAKVALEQFDSRLDKASMKDTNPHFMQMRGGRR